MRCEFIELHPDASCVLGETTLAHRRSSKEARARDQGYQGPPTLVPEATPAFHRIG